MHELGGRRPRAWRRFHVRITALFAVPLFAILAVVAALAYRRAVADEHAILRARLRSVSVALAAAIEPADVAVASPAHARLVATLAAVGRDQPELVALYVLVPEDDRGTMRFVADWDRRGLTVMAGMPYDAAAVPRLMAAVDGPQVETTAVADAWGPTLSGYAPVRGPDGCTVAIVGVDIAAATIAAREREAVVRTAVLFGVALVLLVLVGYVVGRQVRRPLEKIVTATSAVAGGDLAARVTLDRNDELGILGDHFDRMAAGLQERERIRAVFGRYVSEDVARAVLASPDGGVLVGDLREVTILFSDLRGYSTIVEHLAPGDVIAIVNRYLDVMGALVDEHDGCVLELLGDGVLAVFGAPVRTDDHAAQALACAQAMQARLVELNRGWEASGQARAWQDRGLASLAMRIGVHSGKVVAGNIGGATRMKYAVLGDAVNVAARLEQLNKTLGTSLLFSAAARDRLPAAMQARARSRGEHLLKGRGQPVQVFTFDAPPASPSLGGADAVGERAQGAGAGEHHLGGGGGDVGDRGRLLAEQLVGGEVAGPQRAGAVEAAGDLGVAAGGVEEGGER
jgi:adenylate cyclase